MTKEQLHHIFEYKDGNLIYKVKCGKQKIGNIGGSIRTGGYMQIGINKNVYSLHRLIWIYHNGNIPDNLQIDHINRVRNDNRIENLRLVNSWQNLANAKKHKNNISGYKGVCWSEQNKQWKARIMHNNKNIFLGHFSTQQLAGAAYAAAAVKLKGKFACWQ